MIGISFLASAASQHCPPGSRLNIPAESFSYDFTFITSWLLWFGSFCSPSLQFIRSLGPIYGLNRILFIFFSCLSEVRSFLAPPTVHSLRGLLNIPAGSFSSILPQASGVWFGSFLWSRRLSPGTGSEFQQNFLHLDFPFYIALYRVCPLFTVSECVRHIWKILKQKVRFVFWFYNRDFCRSFWFRSLRPEPA